MTKYKKINELLYLCTRSIVTRHYGRAEKLFKKMLQEAFETGDHKLIAAVSMAFIGFRRARVIDTLKILKRIDPIQSKKKELS